MTDVRDGYGYQALKKAVETKLNVPGRKATFYEDLTLDELLDAEKRYLAWLPVTKASKEVKAEKTHMYENYIKKEIAARQTLIAAAEAELLF